LDNIQTGLCMSLSMGQLKKMSQYDTAGSPLTMLGGGVTMAVPFHNKFVQDSCATETSRHFPPRSVFPLKRSSRPSFRVA